MRAGGENKKYLVTVAKSNRKIIGRCKIGTPDLLKSMPISAIRNLSRHNLLDIYIVLKYTVPK
jgi:hypothetical protein